MQVTDAKNLCPYVPNMVRFVLHYFSWLLNETKKRDVGVGFLIMLQVIP